MAPGPAGPAAVSTDLLSTLAQRLRERFSTGRRLALVEGVWQAAFADGELPDEEPWLLARAGELLGFSPAEVESIRQRLRATGTG